MIHPPLAYIKKSSEGFTDVSMLAMSKGGGFFSSGVGVVVSSSVCATGLVGAGGLFSAGIFPAVWTFGGGVTVASGGDFCGSVCAHAQRAHQEMKIISGNDLIIEEQTAKAVVVQCLSGRLKV